MGIIDRILDKWWPSKHLYVFDEEVRPCNALPFTFTRSFCVDCGQTISLDKEKLHNMPIQMAKCEDGRPMSVKEIITGNVDCA